MKKVFLHGTDYESGQKILKNGFNTGEFETVWDCSNPSNVYLIDKEYDKYEALEFAVNAGRLSSAIKNVQSKDIMILEIEVDDIYVDKDTSCLDWDGNDNMNDCYQIDAEYLNRLISSGEALLNVYVMKNAYFPDLRLFYLPHNNPYYCYYDSNIQEIFVNEINNLTLDDDAYCILWGFDEDNLVLVENTKYLLVA